MIQVTPEERYWLEANWSTTSRSVIRVLLPQAMDLVQDLVDGADLDERRWKTAVHAWLAALDVGRKASRTSARSHMYATAMSLFVDADPIRRELTGARSRLDSAQSQAVLRSCLRRGLLSMRYRLTSDSEHRAKTWTRLDRLSRKLHGQRVASGLERGQDGRCHDEHIEAVRLYIVEHARAGESALAEGTPSAAEGLSQMPRKIETLRGYFEEFCPDCGANEDLDSVGVQDIAHLPDADRNLDYLEECIQTLDEPAREVVNAIYQLGAVLDISLSAYCARLGVDRFKLYRLADKAREMLRVCVEGKIEREIV